MKFIAMSGAAAVIAAAGVLSAVAWAGSASSPAKTTTRRTITARKTTTKKTATAKKTKTTTSKKTATTTKKTATTTSKTTTSKTGTTPSVKPSPILAADACEKLVGPRIRALTGAAVTPGTPFVDMSGLVVNCLFDVGGVWAFEVQVATRADAVNYTKSFFDLATKETHNPAAICLATFAALGLTFPSDLPYAPPRVVSGLGDYGFVNDPCPTHYAELRPHVFAAAAGRFILIQFNTDVVASLTTDEMVALTRWLIAQLPPS